MNNSDNDPDRPGGSPPHPAGTGADRAHGRIRHVVAAVAAAAVLVGSGIGIGVALTGGASAAPAANAKTSATNTAATGEDAAGRGACARIERALRRAGYPVAARRAAAVCRSPLLRLAAVGGLHGEVTFRASDGTKTLAFERGTVQTATGSVMVVRASDGTTMTWAVGAATVVREGGRQVTAAKIKAGDVVFVGGQVVTGANDARLIRITAAG